MVNMSDIPHIITDIIYTADMAEDVAAIHIILITIKDIISTMDGHISKIS